VNEVNKFYVSIRKLSDDRYGNIPVFPSTNLLIQDDYLGSMKRFYVDSCIWLNLFKKEGDASKGAPYWKIADSFLKRVMFSDLGEVIYTSVVLREIEHDLNNPSLFSEKLKFIRKEGKFLFVECLKEDYALARKLESESEFSISFFDCLNIAVCSRLDAILVTRDNLLIEFSRGYIQAYKPEHLTV